MVALCNGTIKPQGIAMAYAGHQFGYFVPQLGDGRALHLGTHRGVHLQIKGAGRTYFSRNGDGKAVLRSSIREYLASQAMLGLGIASTDALALIGSVHPVRRESIERGAIVLRAARSWIRFGSFEYLNAHGHPEVMRTLARRVIEESYPHLLESSDPYYALLDAIIERTALMIAQWQGVGFVHGVMNTDNFSIAGDTIDYGPYAFMDGFDKNYVCNHTDTEGRYSYANQPMVAQWNIDKLAIALSPLLEYSRGQTLARSFMPRFHTMYETVMRAKLGLEIAHEEDGALVRWLLGILHKERIDWNVFWYRLSHYAGDRSALMEIVIDREALGAWMDSYDVRLTLESRPPQERLAAMQKTNPKYILKNYMLQEVIDAATQGDFSLVWQLQALAQRPFDAHPDMERYAHPTPLEYRHFELSCSS